MSDPFDTAIPDRSIRTPRVRTVATTIVDIKPLNHDTIELVVEQSDSAPTLRIEAGQFCTLSPEGLGFARPYSLARAANPPGRCSFLIRLLDDGLMSTWLKKQAKLGEVLRLTGPLGDFRLSEGNSSIVCVAGGSGMSAVHAVLEDAARKAIPRDCFFFYGARTESDIVFQQEIRSLAAAWSKNHRLEFVPVLSHEPVESAWDGERGWVSEVARAWLDADANFNWHNCLSLLCGPPPMIDQAEQLFSEAGLPSNNCIFDRFEDRRSPAPQIDNRLCVLCDECLLVKPVDNCIVETSGTLVNLTGIAVGIHELNPTRTSGLYYNGLYIDPNECLRCGACVAACPHGAIKIGENTRFESIRQGRD